MIYRQRLTPGGWIGAILFILGPAVAGYMLAQPILSEMFILAALATPVGAILLLIGREYYDASDEVARESHARRNIAQH